MSLLMDALRRAEAEKKGAAVRGGQPPSTGAATTEGLSLEPLDVTTERSLEDTFDRLTARTRTPARDATVFADGAALETDTTPPFMTASPGPGGAAQPTVVNAQTVFEASRGSGVPRVLVVIIGGAVLLAIGLAAIGFYAYQQTPSMPTLPSPRIAAQVEAPAAGVLPPAAPGFLDTAPASIPPAVEPEPEPEPEPAPAETPLAAAVAQTPSPVAPSSTPGATDPAPPTRVVDPPRSAAAPAILSAQPVTRALTDPIPRDAEIASGEVRIARQTRDPARPDAVTRAYAAFQLGSLDTARTLYSEALARDPARTDALLGLAAIALRENRLAEAHRFYREVLRHEPRQPVASAALFMIEGSAGNDVTEARLKVLADNDADSPYLRFALGNLYARQRRWADAQEAFFTAYSRMPTNADYAFNLAVSLDQLGQRTAALEYYRKALVLRETGPAAFDAAQASARVDAIIALP
jgi:tetratricopeptide (TPR) repeat protein